MKDATRLQMVKILVAHMIDSHGHLPPKAIREEYALGIVMLFPSLKDPYADKAYEHFYDAASGTGYISWRLKTAQRKICHGSPAPPNRLTDSSSGGPNLQRTVNVIHQLDGDGCKEAMSLLKHTTDNSVNFQKMKETFQHRQRLVNDPSRSFLDTKGPVEQDFTLLFDDNTSSRLLQKWNTFFRPNAIKEAKKLTSTPEFLHLVQSSEGHPENHQDDSTTFEKEMTSLLLLHFLPPPPGFQRSPKISASDASQRLVVFHKFPYVNPSHAAVWKSISAINKVGNQTSSLSGIRRARLTPSTSPWISISFHARGATHLGHLMNFSKHIFGFNLSQDNIKLNLLFAVQWKKTCLSFAKQVIYFWLKMTFFYGKQVVYRVF
ncbi:uncharacterized protein LOC100703724 isoform X1 [Oreochromis niloticus]|uniref:uncharacterized protein LOC100703724 isoform X1 n=1 Tax=Oreochromis niloticus TaxID=8128 RepID=UPI000674B26C|nr:uncharacterized protein LOC100703724 isoform X1 [Oreochromis niloticus]